MNGSRPVRHRHFAWPGGDCQGIAGSLSFRPFVQRAHAMNERATVQDQRGKTNPVFNDRKLKLGTFGTNLDRGCAISTIDGVLEINWPNTLELARISEEMEFEALVPIGRWHGFGGHTNFNGPGFECFSWASAIGASTKYSGIFATSHVPTIHPVMAAKQATTIDHVTGGRFALNIVTGWNRPEIEMFGSPLMEHDDRYDCAVEWLDVLKKLWTREEPFDFEGRFDKIKKGYLQPEPIQRPFPAVMNAGGSDRDSTSPPSTATWSMWCSARTISMTARPRSTPTASSRARSMAARSRSGAMPTWCRVRPSRRRRPISTST
jgi:hypothetical protein